MQRMSSELSPRDRVRIESSIREKYKTVASDPRGQFTYPTGREGLSGLNYSPEMQRMLPASVAASYCGVGNPFSLGEVRPGDRVLDIGCGAGVDALLAAALVGDSGSVLGIDLTAAMIRKAYENKRAMTAANITFRQCGIQDLAPADERFDVVISNGVFNLIPDKEDALKTVFDLLEPGGRLLLADQFLKTPTAKRLEERIATWFQ